jgi:hypothetical protein
MLRKGKIENPQDFKKKSDYSNSGVGRGSGSSSLSRGKKSKKSSSGSLRSNKSSESKGSHNSHISRGGDTSDGEGENSSI